MFYFLCRKEEKIKVCFSVGVMRALTSCRSMSESDDADKLLQTLKSRGVAQVHSALKAVSSFPSPKFYIYLCLPASAYSHSYMLPIPSHPQM